LEIIATIGHLLFLEADRYRELVLGFLGE